MIRHLLSYEFELGAQGATDCRLHESSSQALCSFRAIDSGLNNSSNQLSFFFRCHIGKRQNGVAVSASEHLLCWNDPSLCALN